MGKFFQSFVDFLKCFSSRFELHDASSIGVVVALVNKLLFRCVQSCLEYERVVLENQTIERDAQGLRIYLFRV